MLLPRRLRWRWIGLLPLVLATAVAEAIAAAAIFGLLQVLTNTGATSEIRFVAPVSAMLGLVEPREVILLFTIAVMGVYLARLALLSTVTYVKDRVIFESVAHLSERVLHAYLSGPLGITGARDTASMLQRAQRSPEVAAGIGFGSVVHLLSEVLVAVGLIALLAVTAPFITLLAVVLTAGFLLLPAVLTHRLFHRWGEREHARQEESLRQLRQGLGALREIRVYGREAFFQRRVTRARDALSRVQRRRSLLSDVLRLSVETVFVLVLLAVVAVVIWIGSSANLVSLLGLYAYAGFRIVPSANRITLNLNSVRGSLPVARALVADIESEAPSASAVGPGQGLTFAAQIELARVEYAYATGDRPAIHDLSLTIRRGESIGVVGLSGSGKSTLVDLLLGLITPTAGHVRVDGRDIRTHLASWQRQIGYVAQSFYLLDDTLRQNIAFGVDAQQIDQARLINAVKAAQLEDVVASWPQGLDTRIGEWGTRLSGGERQRVAIARALYAQPAILIFDEATAALDPHTEREVTEAIASLHGTNTMVVIAHRIRTVQSCDRLVMLRAGTVAAMGSFDELVSQNDEFRSLIAADAESDASTRDSTLE